MKTLDAFTPLFDFGSRLQSKLSETSESQNIDYEEIRSEAVALVNSTLANETQECPSYRDAVFAQVAWVDELVLSSQWANKNRWAKGLLQKEFFQTSHAGEQFFEKLDSLNLDRDPDQAIRAVFFTCLSWGFQGKYFEAGDKAKLQDIIQTNFELLHNKEKRHVFTQAPPEVAAVSATQSAMNQVKEYAHIIVPVATLIALYLWLRADFISLTSELFRGM